MSPFVANPLDLSSQTLGLLDRALCGVWRELELQNKSPPAKVSEISISPAGPLAKVTALADVPPPSEEASTRCPDSNVDRCQVLDAEASSSAMRRASFLSIAPI
jgi:hypothetical protein